MNSDGLITLSITLGANFRHPFFEVLEQRFVCLASASARSKTLPIGIGEIARCPDRNPADSVPAATQHAPNTRIRRSNPQPLWPNDYPYVYLSGQSDRRWLFNPINDGDLLGFNKGLKQIVLERGRNAGFSKH
jgi:hypothetical protein